MAYADVPLVSQYGPAASPITRSAGCTWTSGANGANISTGSHLLPDQVHAKVAYWEETNRDTPGWSLSDLRLAMDRLGVPFADRSGQGWQMADKLLDLGYALAVQGDSDVFGDNTCSGKFDGDHCIVIHPRASGTRRLIYDPICSAPRWEDMETLRKYAQKLNPLVRFGVFTEKVPQEPGWIAVVHGRTNLYDGNGKVVGAVRLATYETAERVMIDGAWRFRILRTGAGKWTSNAGKYLPAVSTVTYRRP